MKIIALLLSLSLLVITHELGHLGFAKLFHTRVRRFYLFFNWKFSILKAKKFDGKWHFLFFNDETPDSWYTQDPDKPKEQWEMKDPDNTLWGIGWIPLGGYCDIAGMIDETKGTDQLASTPQPWEYRTKKGWQRLCIIGGGVLVNFLSALLIYTCIFAHWGKDELPLRNAELGYEYHQILLDEGFQNGDIIWSIDGQEATDFAMTQQHILLDNPKTVVVKRADTFDTIQLSDDLQSKILRENPREIMGVRMPFVVKEFQAGSIAQQQGMEIGDRVVSINGEDRQTFTDISAALAANKGKEITVGFLRDEDTTLATLAAPSDTTLATLATPADTMATTDTLLAAADGNSDAVVRPANYHEVTLTLGNDGKLGVMLKSPEEVFDVIHNDYTFLQAIPAGIGFGWETLTKYVSSLKLLFTKEGAQSLGGFGTLGSLFPKHWDWQSFWGITAFLAIILAFMNIIPIPGLDGGHILFTLWEIVTRRKPSDRFLEVAQTAGMVLLLGLLVLANGNDLWRWLRHLF